MTHQFPELRMAQFLSANRSQSLQAMHATNPEPFSQVELEQVLNRSFASLLESVPLGFNADEGSPQLRLALAENLYNSVSVDEVVTHAGGQEALFCAFNAVLKAGDKVLAVAPIYEALLSIPTDMGCDVGLLHLESSDDWQLNLDEVERHFRQGCAMFVINYPHNPTGAQISFDDLKKLITLCEQYDVWLLSDEVFRGLEHNVCDQLPAIADLYHKGISIGVISKAFAIPGIRVGWLVSKQSQVIKKVLSIKGYLSICNSQVDEVLATAVIEKHQQVLERNVRIINDNKSLLSSMNSICGVDLKVNIPKVGCCCFVELVNQVTEKSDAVIKTADQVVVCLSQQYRYLLYPSTVFYTDVQGFRVGFGQRGFKLFIQQVFNP